MSDLQGILEKEGGDAERGNRISLRDVTSATRFNAHLRKRRHKHKMPRKRLSGFERRCAHVVCVCVFVCVVCIYNYARERKCVCVCE